MEERERSARERSYEIRQRAYQIWEREGRPVGRDKEHWLLAERELAREQGGAEPQESSDIEDAREYEREVRNFVRQHRLALAQPKWAKANGLQRGQIVQVGREGKRGAKDRDLRA